MAVLEAFGDALDTLRGNPILIAFALVTTLPTTILSNLNAIAPGIGWVGGILNLLVTPFLLGGMYGIVDQAARGDTPTVDRYLSVGTENYLSVLGAYVLAFVVVFICMIPLFILTVILPPVGLLAMLVFGVFAALAGQFLFVYVVLGDATAVSTFGKSLGLVFEHMLAVIGYTLLLAAIGLAFALPFLFLIAAQLRTLGPETVQTFSYGTTTLLALAFSALSSALFYPIQAHFFDRLTAREYVDDLGGQYGGSSAAGDPWTSD